MGEWELVDGDNGEGGGVIRRGEAESGRNRGRREGLE